MEYAGMPPEVASGLVYTGPQSEPLAMAAAAWQALAADLAATATAMQTAVANLVGASWTGPTSVSMGGAGEQHVQWLVQAAAQAEETAALAGQAATVVEAVYTGVVPPPLIAANRAALVALIGSNFMNCNGGAIAANIAHYQGMWAQDSTALYGYAGDSAATVGGLVPFVGIAPTVNPAGAADQALSVSQSAAQAAGNAGQKAASATNQLGSNTSSTAGGGMSDIMSMAPQFLSSVPQVLQGMAQPLMSANPMSSLGSFSSLLSPFMSGLGGSGMGGAPALAAATSPLSSTVGGAGGGLGGIGGGTGGLSAAMGGAPKLGGLSVPATWAASAQSMGGSNNATSATSGINASGAAAPGGTSGGMGGGMGGGAPMAAMNGRDQSGGHGPTYGSPIRVLPRPR